MPKDPTERLRLSCARLSLILPGLQTICSHVYGAKRESCLKRPADDPILLRLSDRYLNKRFDQRLADSLCKLRGRVLATNRQGGGELHVTLPELTMIAFAVRCSGDAHVRHTSRCKTFERDIENQRKRLRRTTINEVGIKFYEDFEERWSAFMPWIRHELQYDSLSNRRSPKGTKPFVRTTSAEKSNPRLAPRPRKKEISVNPIDIELSAWIKELSKSPCALASEREIPRGVRLLKRRAQKGGFDWYTIEDVLEDKKRFEPMVAKYLCSKNVIL